MEALIIAILQYGTTPAILILAFLVALLLRKVEANSKKDDKRAKELETFVLEQIKGMEGRFQGEITTVKNDVTDICKRLSCIEKDYLPREDHYKDISGWRTEINRLSDLIMTLFANERKK